MGDHTAFFYGKFKRTLVLHAVEQPSFPPYLP